MADRKYNYNPRWNVGTMLPGKQKTHQSACPNAPAHHWIIPTPDGASKVDGTCKWCGQTKEFSVSQEFWTTD